MLKKVPEDKREDVFKPFFWGEPLRKTGGVGLAVARNAVPGYRGDISLDIYLTARRALTPFPPAN